MLVANANANANVKVLNKICCYPCFIRATFSSKRFYSPVTAWGLLTAPPPPRLVTTLPCFATCRPEPEPQCTLEPHEGICLLSGKKKKKK